MNDCGVFQAEFQPRTLRGGLLVGGLSFEWNWVLSTRGGDADVQRDRLEVGEEQGGPEGEDGSEGHGSFAWSLAAFERERLLMWYDTERECAEFWSRWVSDSCYGGAAVVRV